MWIQAQKASSSKDGVYEQLLECIDRDLDCSVSRQFSLPFSSCGQVRPAARFTPRMHLTGTILVVHVQLCNTPPQLWPKARAAEISKFQQAQCLRQACAVQLLELSLLELLSNIHKPQPVH